MTNRFITSADIYKALEDVKDPEINTVSVVDLGMVEDVVIAGSRYHREDASDLPWLSSAANHSKECGGGCQDACLCRRGESGVPSFAILDI